MYDCDVVARSLREIGRFARRMPPAWDGARCSAIASGPNGEYFGKVLPGRGLYLAHDLKALGITRPIPHVYQRSNLWRAVEACDRFGILRGRVFDAERAAVRWLDTLAVLGGRLLPACAITSYDGIINARAGGKANDIAFAKSNVTGVANAWSSMWRQGGFPAAGTYTNIPGGATATRATAGALIGLTDPAGADLKYLLTLGLTSSNSINLIILLDLLVGAGNILATTAAAQTVNSAALTRYTTGEGVLATFEITTQLSATAHNITVNSYTNQANTAARSSGAQTSLNAGIVARLTPVDFGPFIALQAGDYGIRSVEQVTFSAALAAGVVALNLYYPLAFVPGVAANMYAERDSTTQIDGLTQLVETSGGNLGALTFFVQPNGTSTGMSGFIRTCSG